MKKLLRYPMLGVIAFFGCFLLSSHSFDGGKGRIKVYIVNNCSQNVNFRVVSPGSSTDYTAYDACKKPMSFMEGTKIYNASNELVLEVTPSCESMEVVVCD